MNIAAMRKSPVGRLVPISGFEERTGRAYEHWAFVPDPLPQAVNLAPATWTQVARAEASLGRLDQASQQIPQPALLRRPALRREAQSTSALEGTFAPFEDVLEPELEERGHLPLEVHEVLNYVVAAEEGFQWVQERPLTAGLVGQLQRVLVRGTPDEHSDAGQLRDRQVVIGTRGASVPKARFVPPPPGDELRIGFDQWIDWVGKPPPDLPPVVRGALAHYQFETLHPFSDGNGRIGRLLIVLQLRRDEVLREPILVVSPWFEERRREYQNALLRLSRDGNWDPWVRLFATGVAAAADDTRDRIENLLVWREDALQTIRDARVSGVAERLAGELIGTPLLTARRVAQDHGISQQGAMNALRRLAAVGLVREGQRRGRRTFFADQVIQLLGR